MRDLSVSSLLPVFAQLICFALLWPQVPSLTLAALVAHIAISVITAYWLSVRWQEQALTPGKIWLFVASAMFFLPVIGSITIALLDNRAALRERGMQAGIGVIKSKTPVARDLLNYFSAPEHYQKGSLRKTRDLLSSLDDEAYLGLLIASRHLPDKEAYALLSEALLSPFESARLMSYALKGKLEERMQENLQSKLDALETTSKKHQAELALAVAQDYLHLLDVGIESTSKAVLLEQAYTYTTRSIRRSQDSASAFNTLATILELQGKPRQAQQSRNRALALDASITENHNLQHAAA